MAIHVSPRWGLGIGVDVPTPKGLNVNSHR